MIYFYCVKAFYKKIFWIKIHIGRYLPTKILKDLDNGTKRYGFCYLTTTHYKTVRAKHKIANSLLMFEEKVNTYLRRDFLFGLSTYVGISFPIVHFEYLFDRRNSDLSKSEVAMDVVYV